MMMRILSWVGRWLVDVLELLAPKYPEVITVAGPMGDPVGWLIPERMMRSMAIGEPGELG